METTALVGPQRDSAELSLSDLLTQVCALAQRAPFPFQRNASDIALLQKYLVKSQASIFGGLSDTSIDLICKNLAFVSYGDGDILFMQGDIGDAFYIVLSGRVSVHIHDDEKHLLSLRDQTQEKMMIARRRRSMDLGSMSLSGGLRTIRRRSSQGGRKNLDAFPPGSFGTVVAQNGAGFAFGELSLYSEERNRRNATVASESAETVGSCGGWLRAPRMKKELTRTDDS